MRFIITFIIFSLIVGVGQNAFAEESKELFRDQTEDIESNEAYHTQLEGYSGIYEELQGGLMAERQKAIDELREKNAKAQMEKMQLDQEYDELTTGMETKEENISRLKSINKKLRAAQAKMYTQYSELEELFDEQKMENEGLKQELEDRKSKFYEKMIKFYQEESALLGDKIKALQEQYDEVGSKLEMMKADQQEVAE